MADNTQTFANRIYGEIVTREKYKFADSRLIAEVVRDTVEDIDRMRAEVADRRGVDRVPGPAFERIQAAANKAADEMENSHA